MTRASNLKWASIFGSFPLSSEPVNVTMIRQLELWALESFGKDSLLGKMYRPLAQSFYRVKKEGQRVESLVLSRFERDSFEDLETFCLFIGYPRSGHSIVGALLDAHPSAQISHELGAVKLIHEGFNRNQIFSLILANSRAFAQKGRKWSGYSYEVPGQWQGKAKKLTVIGDKKGGNMDERLNWMEEVDSCVQLPVKFVHVIRNPYDNIARMATKVNPYRETRSEDIDESIEAYFDLVRKNERLIAQREAAVLNVHHEDLIAQAQDSLKALCDFLGLEALDDYVEACASIVFEKPNKSRDLVDWSPEQLQRIAELSSDCSFLKSYQFDS